MHYLEKEYYELIQKDKKAKHFVTENSVYGAYYWNLEKPNEIWISTEFWNYLGYEYKEEKQNYQELVKIVFPDDLRIAKAIVNKHFQDPSFSYNQIIRFYHKKGHIVWVRCKAFAIRNKENKVIRLLGVHSDIALDKKPEEEISEKSSFFLKAVLDSSLDGIMAFESVIDKNNYEIVDFIFKLSNIEACKIVNMKEEYLLGKSLKDIMPGNFEPLNTLDGRSLFEIYKEVVNTGKTKKIEFYFEHHGIKEWFSNKIVKFENGFVCTFSVITELKRTQKELSEKIEYEVKKRRENEEVLLHQSKLASMGEVLSSVAHNWRQPLNTTSLLVSSLNSKLEFSQEIDNDYIEEWSNKLNIQLKYMSQTIDDFRNFFKQDENKTNFNLEKSLYYMISLLIPEFDIHNILVKIDSSREIEIFSFERQLQQAILNILNNSKDALVLNNIKKPLIKIELKEENENILIIISDNAGGISDSNIFSKILEPYFTTKEGGTGVGLYITKTIISKNLDGKIEYFNSKDGLTFKIILQKSRNNSLNN